MGYKNPLTERPWTPKQKAVNRAQRWTDAQKISAVAMYMELPNCNKISEITGIPAHTLRYWRTEPWWYEVEQKILKEQDAEITSKFTRIVNKAQDKVLDRVENGDWIIKKDGTTTRKPMSGRDLQYVASQSVINRNLLLDRPTSRTETVSMKDHLAKLHAEFEKFSKAKTLEGEKVETSTEVSHEHDNGEEVSEPSGMGNPTEVGESTEISEKRE